MKTGNCQVVRTCGQVRIGLTVVESEKKKSGVESPKDTILVAVRGQFHMTVLPDAWCDPVATGWQGQGYNLDACHGDSSVR